MSRNTTMVYRDQADNSRPATIGELHSELSTLDKHLTSEFQSQYTFHQDVTSNLLKRIEDLDHKLEKRIDELEHKFEKLRRSVDALSRNRLAIRPFMQIWMYPTDGNEIPRYFPKNVAMFWSLREPPNQHKLASLLESYGYKDYLAWAEFDEFGDPIEMTELPVYPGTDNPLKYYVEQYPEQAHRTLGSILGLEYDLIHQEIEKIQSFRAQEHGGSSKRPVAKGDTGMRKSTRFAVSDNSSLTEEIHRGEPGDYKQTRISSSPS